MFLSDLTSECNESIVAHHASGHFTREHALAVLTAKGLTSDKANALLDAPVDVALFHKYKTYPPEMRPV